MSNRDLLDEEHADGKHTYRRHPECRLCCLPARHTTQWWVKKVIQAIEDGWAKNPANTKNRK